MNVQDIRRPDQYGDTVIVDRNTLDVVDQEDYEHYRRYVVEDAQIVLAHFDHFTHARQFQRLFRIGNGLDPATGNIAGNAVLFEGGDV